MLRSIFVPLDGSSFGEQALPLASALARRASARLTLAMVHVPATSVDSGSWNMLGVPRLDAERDQAQRERECAYLAQVRPHLSGLQHVDCRVLDGPIADTLLQTAADSAADLVVLTTHGRGAFGRVWMGSVADAMIRRSTAPTLVVRPSHITLGVHMSGTLPFAPRRLLVALDGSPLAEHVLPAVLDLAQLYSSRVTLVRVIEPSSLGGGAPDFATGELEAADRHAAHADALAYLQRIAAELRGAVTDVAVRVAHGPAAAAILETAATVEADLVVLATHGRGGMTRLVMGSVADRVVRGASTPVLVVRPYPEPAARHVLQQLDVVAKA